MRQGNKRTTAYPDFGKRLFYVVRENNTDIIKDNSTSVNIQKLSGYNQTDLLQKILYNIIMEIKIKYIILKCLFLNRLFSMNESDDNSTSKIKIIINDNSNYIINVGDNNLHNIQKKHKKISSNKNIKLFKNIKQTPYHQPQRHEEKPSDCISDNDNNQIFTFRQEQKPNKKRKKKNKQEHQEKNKQEHQEKSIYSMSMATIIAKDFKKNSNPSQNNNIKNLNNFRNLLNRGYPISQNSSNIYAISFEDMIVKDLYNSQKTKTKGNKIYPLENSNKKLGNNISPSSNIMASLISPTI
jgi:hypothetical protein